jgi:hypothetical protein
MCDPLVIAGLALSAGAAVTNSMAAGADARARDAVLAAERMRQNRFDQETDALNVASQDRYVDFAPQMETRAQSIGDYLSGAVAPDPNSSVPSVLPSSSSGVVNQERANQQEQANEFVGQQQGALADLRSFGDLLGDISLLQSRDATQIGSIGGFKRGSQNIVPFELNEAAKAGDDMRLFADILGGVGSAATGYGIGGGWGKLGSMFAAPKAISFVPGIGDILAVT